MTPKDKAEEIVNKFEYAKKYSNTTNAMSKELAKQCALITCNKVLGYMGADRGYAYWENVKTEIEKL